LWFLLSTDIFVDKSFGKIGDKKKRRREGGGRGGREGRERGGGGREGRERGGRGCAMTKVVWWCNDNSLTVVAGGEGIEIEREWRGGGARGGDGEQSDGGDNDAKRGREESKKREEKRKKKIKSWHLPI